ncbi:hypothetical protein T440DRAFT_484205 [Plenodomus tracheiphilus IPT5]|uniref:Alpha/beta-hydrolase n=1 Tax=Plenodomus tracheiphilus IPT5 TaxID=1408161 RepID=A0A6A7AMX2_9PLEO|nr:hypothetical protein T440DRAFT_484205 [Plenodomus tracheiphilus IPT5]
MSSMDDSDTEAKFRAAARDVHRGEEELHEVFNPQDLEEAARAVFSEDKFVKALLEEFSIHEFTYDTIWPAEDRCPPAMRAVAVEEIGGPIHADLMAKVAVPVELLETEKAIHIKVGLRYGGGGGTTGTPMFGPWLFRADLEYARKTGNMIIVDIGYPMVTRSSGKVILGSITSMWRWVFTELQPALTSINRHFTIDWDSIYLFGVSFGGGLAVRAWMEMANQVFRPSNSRIRAVVIRCPLLDDYCLDPAEYVGISISQERAVRDCARALEILGRTPWTIPKSNLEPPTDMYGGPMLSMGRCFAIFWKEKTVMQFLIEMKECPGIRTRFFIRHGDADKHVKPEGSAQLVTILKQWSVYVDLKLQKNKPHAWDAQEPLEEELRSFLDGS